MTDWGLRWGAAVLFGFAALALLAPWLGLRDPTAQPDGLVLRDLPPLSRVDAILTVDGKRRYAEELRPLGDGGVEYRRGDRWTSLSAADLGGASEELWHQRALFVLGTDAFGRDVLSRLVYGSRVSLLVGLVGALIAVFLGAAIGLTAGLLGGWVDVALMRFTDLTLAVPRLFLALLLIALYGASMTTTLLVLGGTTWMAGARLVRGEVLSLRERDFVQAARAAGAPRIRVGVLHLLPAALTPVIVEGTLRVGDTILLEAALSFLGLGVPPPAPSWGNLIADGRDSLLDAWWVSTFPGLAIAAAVIALNLVGDAARRRLDASARIG